MTKPERAKPTKFEPAPAPEIPPDTDLAQPVNKYGKKPKIGTPTIGRHPNYVETVGLNKLRVITANGNY